MSRPPFRWQLPLAEAGGRGPATLSATRLFLFSFLCLIVIGTLGFLLLPGIYTGPRLGFVDSLFTATSAVCVTGLIVVDTATYFTPLGQAWIALLIQLGGLGMLSFATLIVAAAGRRASLGVEEAAGGHASAIHHLDEVALVRAVFAATFLLEALGAGLLWLAWRSELGPVGAVWPAVFHAISAFCNAGFSVFSDSLEGWRSSVLALGTVMVLVVLGGIGFLVLADLRARFTKGMTRRLSTHGRLALLSTGVLLLGAAALYLLFESGGRLSDLGLRDRLLNAAFMSVTPRTAGFNTVQYDAISNPSLFLTILLMIVGGSPGSAAGGLKTTTFALLGLALWSRLRGRRSVALWGRTVPGETVQRATALAVGALATLAVGVFLLSMTEASTIPLADRTGFIRLVFEAHSAFGTVGLSMGATGDLSTAGRLVITVLMFVGRVGPLAVASAMEFAGSRRRPQYRYSYEDVIIG